MATVATQHILKLMATKVVNLDNGGDGLKIILLNPSFTFNRGSMHLYGDVSSFELLGVNGYTVGGADVAGQAITQDNTSFKTKFTCNSTTWTATGGSLVAAYAAIYDDTATDDPLVMIIDFGGTLTALSGQPLIVPTPEVDFNC